MYICAIIVLLAFFEAIVSIISPKFPQELLNRLFCCNERKRIKMIKWGKNVEEWNGRQHDLNGMGIKVNVIKYQALKENN